MDIGYIHISVVLHFIITQYVKTLCSTLVRKCTQEKPNKQEEKGYVHVLVLISQRTRAKNWLAKKLSDTMELELDWTLDLQDLDRILMVGKSAYPRKSCIHCYWLRDMIQVMPALIFMMLLSLVEGCKLCKHNSCNL